MSTRPRYIDLIEEDFAKALGAGAVSYQEKLSLFLAHKDRNGADVPDIQQWIERAEAVLAGIGGGATSLEVQGAWLGPRTTPLHEVTTVVYTYASPEMLESSVSSIRKFMYAYGTETGQGEVAVVLENGDGDWFFRVERDVFAPDAPPSDDPEVER